MRKLRLLGWTCSVVAIATAAVLLYVFAPRRTPLSATLAQLQGRWEVVRHQGGPLTFDLRYPDPYEGYIDFVDNQAIPALAQKGAGWYFVIDAINQADESPWIDWTEIGVANGNRIASRKGVYRLDGDTLTLCMALPGEDRPQGVVENDGVGHPMVIVLKRAK